MPLMQNQCLVNGQPATTVSITDRGLAYGQGVFETILVYQGIPCLLDAHLTRLEQGCARLNIPAAGLRQQLLEDLQVLKRPSDSAVLKITVTCGSGGRGYATPETPAPTRILNLSPLPDYSDNPDQGINVRWCETRLVCQPALSGIKHLNRLEQVLARSEWHDPRIREGLVCDTRGYVVEGTMSNLFMVSGSVLHTPDLSQAGIDGIMRNEIIRAARQAGLKVEVGQYSPQQVEAASELFLCNSLIGIWPIIRLEDLTFNLGDTTRYLQSLQLQRKET
ncbi:aminodeoxychorismate lyase [Marinobacterium alkalitolerans]|nr:aminodeoxychorismate lyase [Marinobacterium alkalitolerans]